MDPGDTHVVDAARALCPAGQDVLEVLAPGGSRILVPMGNRRVLRSSSTLYPAFLWKERAYRAGMWAWISFGRVRFTHRVIPKRTGDWPLGNVLLPDFPTLSKAAVYVGIPGPDRKMAVQLMDDRGGVLGFAKYADKPRTRALVANEARMLETIPKNVGPRLVRFVPFLGGELAVQTPLPGRARPPSPRLDAAQMRLLERLVRPEQVYAASEHPFVQRLYERVGGHRKSMLEATVEDLEGSEWPLAWAHGDLSPWNMHWWRGECLAFDWEYGKESGLAYLDAPHTLIQFAGLIQKSDPRRAKQAISGRLRASLPPRYVRFAPALAALSALNMLLSWYPPREPDAYEHWLTAFVEASP